MSFGALLAEQRSRRGMSQTFLSNLLETTQRHLSFLETGRSRPSREMIMRISDTLSLGTAERTGLFEAAGFTSPYKQRTLDDEQIVEALAIIEGHVLANWPYPAFALTPEWTILLANAPGAALLGSTPEAIKAEPISFFEMLLSRQFRDRILNWDDVAAAFHARLRRHAMRYPDFGKRLQQSIDDGVFVFDPARLAEKAEIPALLPIEMALPDGSVGRITSLAAHFTSAHDAHISDIEIELMVPLPG